MHIPKPLYEIKPYLYIFISMVIWLVNMQYFAAWILASVIFLIAYRILEMRRIYRERKKLEKQKKEEYDAIIEKKKRELMHQVWDI